MDAVDLTADDDDDHGQAAAAAAQPPPKRQRVGGPAAPAGADPWRADAVQRLHGTIKTIEEARSLMKTGKKQFGRGVAKMQESTDGCAELCREFTSPRSTLPWEQALRMKRAIEVQANDQRRELATHREQGMEEGTIALIQHFTKFSTRLMAIIEGSDSDGATANGAAGAAPAAAAAAAPAAAAPPTGAPGAAVARAAPRPIGGADGGGRLAPPVDVTFANFMALLNAEQRVLLGGKPLTTAAGHATVQWRMQISRADVVDSLLKACGKCRSKKELLCGGTIVKFAGEDGVDGGGLTKEMWTLFRHQLLRPRLTAAAAVTAAASGARPGLSLFTGFIEEETQKKETEKAFVPRVPEAAPPLDRYRELGRALLAVVRDQQVLPSTFAQYVLAYLCAEDALPRADRAAIGTCGSPDTDDEALREVEAVLGVVKALDPDLATNM